MKRIAKALIIIYIVMSFFCIANASTYFITGDGVRVRSSAENKDNNIIGKLNYGDIIDVVKKEGSWYKIKYGKGYGYVTYRYVSSEMYSSNTIALSKKAISLKKSSSSSSKTICSIPKGAVVKVISTKSSWSYVEYNEQFGYVEKKNLTTTTNSKELAVGTYTVSYSLSNSSRNKNISTAMKKLNKYTIKPGQTFSFIKVVGTSGYANAPEFNKNQKVLGGGLSQVATSLFLSVRDAQRNGCYISVKTQNRYSSKTPYAKLGEEAMIDLKAKKDLTFKNCSNKTVKIYSNVTGDNVSFVISYVK